MKHEIIYNDNTQLWKMEAVAEENGYTKKEECYWVQIFENSNGDSIVCSRENNIELNHDPVDRLRAILSREDERAFGLTTIEKEIEKNAPIRSHWNRGVKLYAFEIAEKMAESIEYLRENNELPKEIDYLEIALNGAENWTQYSEGGLALIYNDDIASRLCTPSEYAAYIRTGKKPNSREDWIDVQSRALYQAWQIVSRAISTERETFL